MASYLNIQKEIFDPDWLKILLSLKLEIRIVFTVTPPINSFCKIYSLKEVDVCQKANSQFVKFFSFYEEIPEEFLDEFAVDNYFHQNIFDISQSEHRTVRVTRESNKKSFAIKLFQFWGLKTQQRYILQEHVKISKKELTSLVDSLGFFLKTFDHASKCIQIPLPKLKIEMRSLLITMTISLNIQIDKFVYRSDLETTILAYFPSKCLNYTAINFF